MLAGPATGVQEAQVPAYVRARGGVRLRFGRAGGVTQRLALHESGGYRARFPTSFAAHAEAVLINTGGGMTGGDSLGVEIALDDDAHAVVTTQAAEKIYRSQGPQTTVSTQITLASGARLDWLPQETILFSGARLHRTLEVEMAADAALFACESVFFGRVAMGEVLEAGAFRDTWRIRRAGRLVFADNLRLEGLVNLALAKTAVADGSRALATVVLLQEGAERRLDEARAALAGAESDCGATAHDGLLIARFLGRDAARLRADLAQFLNQMRGTQLPRSWQT